MTTIAAYRQHPNRHVRRCRSSQSQGPDKKRDRSSSPMEPPVFVMVDGEFSGPHFRRHGVLAWSLVAFRKAATVAEAVVPDGTITVHLTMPRGATMDPLTKSEFFDRNPGLLEGLAKGAVSPAEGMARVAAFLSASPVCSLCPSPPPSTLAAWRTCCLGSAPTTPPSPTTPQCVSRPSCTCCSL